MSSCLSPHFWCGRPSAPRLARHDFSLHTHRPVSACLHVVSSCKHAGRRIGLTLLLYALIVSPYILQDQLSKSSHTLRTYTCLVEGKQFRVFISSSICLSELYFSRKLFYVSFQVEYQKCFSYNISKYLYCLCSCSVLVSILCY